MQLEQAIQIACKAHAGQVDKGGAPYILHALRVMLAVPSHAQVVAVLHDVLEDTPWTTPRLRDLGLTDEEERALLAVTRRRGEGYTRFIDRCAGNPIAREVKLADLTDNSDLSRLSSPGPEDFARVEKYRAAAAFLHDVARRADG